MFHLTCIRQSPPPQSFGFSHGHSVEAACAEQNEKEDLSFFFFSCCKRRLQFIEGSLKLLETKSLFTVSVLKCRTHCQGTTFLNTFPA